MRAVSLTTVENKRVVIDLDTVQAIVSNGSNQADSTLILSSGTTLRVFNCHARLVEKWVSPKQVDSSLEEEIQPKGVTLDDIPTY